ncbi:MAG: DUF2066 domain-containing protein [Flavobacteriaceae bacterium]
MLYRTIALVLVLLMPVRAAAEIVADLYQAKALVTGTEEPERSRGFRAALADVAVKITGDTALERDTRLEGLLARAPELVASYTYEDRMKGIPVHDEQGTRERPHILTVTFDTERLDAAIATLGYRRWSEDRPVVAVWLGIGAANGNYVLGSGGSAGYGQRAVLTESAARRGLPIRLPAEGQSAITYEDVAGRRPAVFRASPPEAAAHLLGTLIPGGDGYWTMEWTLRHAGQETLWRLRGVTFDQALKSGIDTTVGLLRAAPAQ